MVVLAPAIRLPVSAQIIPVPLGRCMRSFHHRPVETGGGCRSRRIQVRSRKGTARHDIVSALKSVAVPRRRRSTCAGCGELGLCQCRELGPAGQVIFVRQGKPFCGGTVEILIKRGPRDWQAVAGVVVAAIGLDIHAARLIWHPSGGRIGLSAGWRIGCERSPGR